ncbi:cyclin-dependent kinase 12-like [Boleophthalmus pectinirostris]|uniref:cyclin-dependent kinase 12-like n=1 Tax=Boleophthalmus pectinirostris TaxID=150288 RepID=UPI0024313EC1|nr:cyclin-dependent kinase 12-like [Boleophthalmus pectinirostris]
MTHGQVAQDPEVNRVSECVCLRLAKEFEQARNRPKDTKGKTLPIPQSIVSVYGNIRQLLEDSRVVLDQTNMVLVPLNNTTVSSWLLRRDKRKDRDMLLQDTVLPEQPLPAANTLLAAPVQHAHDVMTFEEPENCEGEAFPRQRTLAANKQSGINPPFPPLIFPPQFGPVPQFQHPPPFLPAHSYLHSPFIYAPWQQALPCPDAPPLQQPPTACLPSQPRQRAWRLNKTAQEDEELASRGEPPKKRLSKEQYHYTCKQCGQDKSKRTGHTQVKGRWYSPASGLSLEDWRNSLQ